MSSQIAQLVKARVAAKFAGQIVRGSNSVEGKLDFFSKDFSQKLTSSIVYELLAGSLKSVQSVA